MILEKCKEMIVPRYSLYKLYFIASVTSKTATFDFTTEDRFLLLLPASEQCQIKIFFLDNTI